MASKETTGVGGHHGGGFEHLIVFVNGLFGNPSNWDVIIKDVRKVVSDATLLHASAVNAYTQTYEGIDVCGERLANEIRDVVAQHATLRRISIVAHSMGGLIARYAAGVLYDDSTHSIAGLQPMHFITLATPHLGCSTVGAAEIPFVGWFKAVPLFGRCMHSIAVRVAPRATAKMFGCTGRQFFLEDVEHGNEENALLLQMVRDDPTRADRMFMSALKSFRSRTCYANATMDHIVGWANSSIRKTSELPELHLSSAERVRGVVREDPIAFAFSTDAREAGGTEAPQQAVQMKRFQPLPTTSPPSSARSNAASMKAALTRRSVPPHDARNDDAAQHAQQPNNKHRKHVSWGGDADAVALQHLQPPSTAPLLTPNGARVAERHECSTDTNQRTSASDATAAAGKRNGGLSVDASQRHPTPPRSKSEQVDVMLAALQQLPWRRIDVHWRDTCCACCGHNHIQVTRLWLNWKGLSVPRHIAAQLEDMETIIAASSHAPSS